MSERHEPERFLHVPSPSRMEESVLREKHGMLSAISSGTECSKEKGDRRGREVLRKEWGFEQTL